MPFIPNTPESRLGRSDSLNPATTCRGITSGGRPCRRPLNSSPGSSPLPPPPKINKLRVDDPRNADLYCWQHKDQAVSSAKSSPGPRSNMTPILESRQSRQSLESLIDRLGIVEAQKHGKRPTNNHYGEKIGTYPPRRPKTKQSSLCCCFTLTEEEEELPARPQPRPLQSAPAKPMHSRPAPNQHLVPPPAQTRPSGESSRPHSNQSDTSQTAQYLSLIPATASPQTASQLMAELAKPISPQDEAGYIYIFWLTPESQRSTPPTDAAKSLLSPPRPDGGRQRRTSDVMESFAVKESKTTGSSKKILLKIGRASNVQRRLNEWTRQCGFDISLVRFYPYVSSSQQEEPRKMPHSHKVERLVHLELAGAGLRVSDKANCEACGKAHKEWFEIDANKNAISMVDEVIKRWSDWDEANA